MAKRRDQLIAMAQDREAGAKIATLKSVKEFTVSVGDIRRLRETNPDGSEGRVYKQVHLLTCHCRLAGVAEPIEAEIEMAAGEGWGVAGELDSCIMPGLQTFLDHVKARYIAAVKAKDKPLPGVIPHYANPDGTMAKPPNPGRVEAARRMNAARQAQKLQQSQDQPTEAAAEPGTSAAEATEGGDV